MAINKHLLFLLLAASTFADAHSGGLNKQGCHSGSQPYHCHSGQKDVQSTLPNSATIEGTITHVRDGDTIEIDGTAIRLAALNCPEKGNLNGDNAMKLAKQFEGLKAICQLTGAKTYDRLVGYCTINGADFGRHMIDNSSCTVWKKYDVWKKYQN